MIITNGKVLELHENKKKLKKYNDTGYPFVIKLPFNIFSVIEFFSLNNRMIAFYRTFWTLGGRQETDPKGRD